MIGRVVYSAAGRDKGRFMVIVGSEGEYPLVCDGKLRPLERPKLKNPKHLKPTGVILAKEQFSTNRSLRRALSAFYGNGKEQQEETICQNRI